MTTSSNGFATKCTRRGGDYQTLINEALREHVGIKQDRLEHKLRTVVREELARYERKVAKR